jgi:DMSO/TMAO reductase YedYZ molybdopterin-dependent catalytic subunit
VSGRSTNTREDPPRTAAWSGVALGAAFTICAITGWWSHLQQHPPAWLDLPARPAGLYRITQGLHVVTGVASIPLLLAKLATVHHHLVAWPPVRSVAHAVERVFLLPLVGGSAFLLLSGVANVARWYPWGFFFPAAHGAVAWITMGALVVHVGAKWATTRTALAPTTSPLVHDRRALLGGAAATSGLLAISVAGATVPGLSPFAFLAQRRAGQGPQGVPVNKTAAAAGVIDAATATTWRLHVTGRVTRPLSLSLAELRAMPQREAELPIACVEGWSASARWAGVPVAALLEAAGAEPGAEVVVRSLQVGGLYPTSELSSHQSRDRDTLVALTLAGAPLHIDHGYPARLIGPARPGVAQTKWLAELEVR